MYQYGTVNTTHMDVHISEYMVSSVIPAYSAETAEPPHMIDVD